MAKSTFLTSPTQRKGKHYENLALSYLKKQGLTLITQNYVSSCGEIDLIFKGTDAIIFLEVRYRKSCRYGNPVETVSPRKQKKIINTAKLYLLKHGLYEKIPCRFDILGITNTPNATPILHYQWIKNAFH